MNSRTDLSPCVLNYKENIASRSNGQTSFLNVALPVGFLSVFMASVIPDGLLMLFYLRNKN